MRCDLEEKIVPILVFRVVRGNNKTFVSSNCSEVRRVTQPTLSPRAVIGLRDHSSVVVLSNSHLVRTSCTLDRLTLGLESCVKLLGGLPQHA